MGSALREELRFRGRPSSERPPGGRQSARRPPDLERRQGRFLAPAVHREARPVGPARPVDRQIAEIARARGGVYALEPAEGGDAHPQERRLRELERMGLASREASHRWKVSLDLLQRLAERQRDAPVRRRLFVRIEPLSLEAQVRHPGPAGSITSRPAPWPATVLRSR